MAYGKRRKDAEITRMLWGRIAAYWNQRKRARMEWRAAILHEQGETERRGGAIHADNRQMVSALERIGNQNDASALQRQIEYNRVATRESRRLTIEIAAVIVAFIGAF